MSAYGQFCPVAKAMELLDERWTMLIVRELVSGSRHFNELRRGVPKMSPALLSKRLRMLVRHGVIERHTDGNRVTYTLTPAGKELEPIVRALGRWGTRWISELGDEDLDPHLLIWDVSRNVDLATVPPGRTVLKLTFSDLSGPARDWWLLLTPEDVDACDFDPGHEVTATVSSSLRTFIQVWRGDLSWREALTSGQLEVQAPAHLRRAVPRWLRLSPFASVPRPA